MHPASLQHVASSICNAHGYRLVQSVGSGSFKETYEVVSSDGAHQALKVFQPGFSPARTKRELEAMTRCEHPNIGKLSYVSTFPWQGQTYLFLVEEFVPGGTLTSRLRTQGLLSPTEGAVLGAQLIDAVAHIASHGLVHRDLKPDNILLRADGATPVIVDFGIVRDLAEVSLTPTWSLRGPGTPFFSSPEQLNNEKAYIDWRADQFSLGVIICVSMFGFHPFEQPGSTPDEVVELVAERRTRAERFHAAVRDTGFVILERMTAPWPAQRFRHPHLLAEAWCASLQPGTGDA